MKSDSEPVRGSGDDALRVLRDSRFEKIARETGESIPVLYRWALEIGIWPCRYLKNRTTMTSSEQLKLAASSVAVAGVGGLGGHVALMLARIGVGRIMAIDHDLFEETNMNRQPFSRADALGKPKVDEALRTVTDINPGVVLVPLKARLGPHNVHTLLEGADVVVDALDSAVDRLALEKGAQGLRLPLVHGALRDFEGQLMTVFPEDTGLKTLYGSEVEKWEEEAVREDLGTPSPTPAFLGAALAMEAIKVLLGWKPLFRWNPVHVDLRALDIMKHPDC